MFENFQERPERQRKMIAWIAIAVCMACIITIWIISLRNGVLQARTEDQIQEAQEQEQAELEDQKTLEDVLNESSEQFQDLIEGGAKLTPNEDQSEQLPKSDVKVIKPQEEPQTESPEDTQAQPSPTTLPNPTTTPTEEQ